MNQGQGVMLGTSGGNTTVHYRCLGCLGSASTQQPGAGRCRQCSVPGAHVSLRPVKGSGEVHGAVSGQAAGVHAEANAAEGVEGEAEQEVL